MVVQLKNKADFRLEMQGSKQFFVYLTSLKQSNLRELCQTTVCGLQDQEMTI